MGHGTRAGGKMRGKSLDWGIDLGGTKCECVVLDGDKVLLRHRIPTE